MVFMKINSKIELKMASESIIDDYFQSIHKDVSQDEYRDNLQKKYPTKEMILKRIKDMVGKTASDGTPDFFIYYEDELAGVFEFHPLTNDDYLEVGYWLFAEFRRKNILSEIFPHMIQYVAEHFNKSKIRATTAIDNDPSKRLLEKVGFIKTGKIFEEQVASGIQREFEYMYFLPSVMAQE